MRRIPSRLVVTMTAGLFLFAACGHRPIAPRLNPVTVRASHHYQDGRAISRPADGKVFLTVELTHDGELPERYEWIYAKAIDNHGKSYEAKYANAWKSESSTRGLFGFGNIRTI